jgi:hypothetical protein
MFSPARMTMSLAGPDVDEAFIVEPADVAAVEPAVDDGLGGGLGLVQ